MNLPFAYKSVLTALLMLLFSCELSTTSSAEGETGSGSEVVGRAEYEETASIDLQGPQAAKTAQTQLALPAIGAAVYLYPESFQPDINKDPASYVPSVYTDSNGAFRIENVHRGVWVLEVRDGDGNSAGRKFTVAGEGKLVDLGVIKMKKPASLAYVIKTDLPGNSRIRHSLYVLGTRISAKGTEENLKAEIKGIPTGLSHSVKFVLNEPFTWSKTFKNINLWPEQATRLDIDLPSI